MPKRLLLLVFPPKRTQLRPRISTRVSRPGQDSKYAVLGLPLRRTNPMHRPIGYPASNFEQNDHSWTILGAIPTFTRQHSYTFQIPTPGDAPSQPEASTIKTVTRSRAISHRSRVSQLAQWNLYIPSGNRLIHSTSLTTSMTWLMFCEPDPKIISLDKSDSEASANLQDIARNARFSSRARSRTKTSKRHKAVYKKTRCLSAHLFVLCQRVTPKAVLCRATPKGCRQIVGYGWPFFWPSLSSCKAMIRAVSGCFVRCESVDNLARFKPPSRSTGKPSKLRKKMTGNPKL